LRLAAASFRQHDLRVADLLIERDEVVALLFNVSDIASSLAAIEEHLGGGDEDGEEEADES
jgi:hypothetical protein